MASDGLFLDSAFAQHDGTITVEIRQGEHRKQFVRHFRLQFDAKATR